MEMTEGRPTRLLNFRRNEQSVDANETSARDQELAFRGFARELGILLARRDIQSGEVG